jgi:hypothetical protein
LTAVRNVTLLREPVPRAKMPDLGGGLAVAASGVVMTVLDMMGSQWKEWLGVRFAHSTLARVLLFLLERGERMVPRGRLRAGGFGCMGLDQAARKWTVRGRVESDAFERDLAERVRARYRRRLPLGCMWSTQTEKPRIQTGD